MMNDELLGRVFFHSRNEFSGSKNSLFLRYSCLFPGCSHNWVVSDKASYFRSIVALVNM